MRFNMPCNTPHVGRRCGISADNHILLLDVLMPERSPGLARQAADSSVCRSAPVEVIRWRRQRRFTPLAQLPSHKGKLVDI